MLTIKDFFFYQNQLINEYGRKKSAKIQKSKSFFGIDYGVYVKNIRHRRKVLPKGRRKHSSKKPFIATANIYKKCDTTFTSLINVFTSLNN